jgi:addiction module RelE/StbE family toxin
VQVRWLRTALANLNAEAEYIARENPEAASRVVATIISAVDHLGSHPAMGRAGRVPGTRELVVPNTPYIVPYRVKEGTVQILRVFHSARRWRVPSSVLSLPSERNEQKPSMPPGNAL